MVPPEVVLVWLPVTEMALVALLRMSEMKVAMEALLAVNFKPNFSLCAMK